VARDFRIVLIVTGKERRLQGGRVLGGRIARRFVGWLNRADNRGAVCAASGLRTRVTRRAAPSSVLLRRPPLCQPLVASSRSWRATPHR